MTALIDHPRPMFEGFGDSILARQTRGQLERYAIPEDRMEARAMLHDHCPLVPGVYGWLDSRQQICYVGKSKSLRKRLLSYFAKTPTDKKAHRIRQHSQWLVWEPVSDELLALLREQELIFRWRPEFNTQGQPTKRQPGFICFSGGIAPNVFFTRRITRKATCAFGPIAGTSRLRAAVESVNQSFHLRDCPDKTKFEFNNQSQLFANPQTAQCIRYELGSCPGPCAANCSRQQYLANVDRAIDFFAGVDPTILHTLECQMDAAAKAHSFERAAILRDHVANLAWLDRRLGALRLAIKELNGVLPVQANKSRTAWLFLKGGRILGSQMKPRSIRQAIATAKKLAPIAKASHQMAENLMDMNIQLIMISWFRKHPNLKQSLLPFTQAIEICEAIIDRKPRPRA